MTQKQLQLVMLINNYTQITGEAPTYSEIKKSIGVTSNQTVSDHLDALERSGLIKRRDGKKRGIMLTIAGQRLVSAEQVSAVNLPISLNTPSMLSNSATSALPVVQSIYLPQVASLNGDANYVINHWNYKSSGDHPSR
jgi:SOS-response transcriptional repressor LexA